MMIAFNDVALQGHKYIIPVLPWIHSAGFAVDWTVRVDSITAGGAVLSYKGLKFLLTRD